MSVPIPHISVDGMSTLKPELIGLAAFLAAITSSYSGDAVKILRHVGDTGSLDGLSSAYLSEKELAAAKVAHSEWLDFLAASDASPVRPLLPALRRNGHHLPLPPIAGGAPSPERDLAWMGVSDADLEF